MKFKGIIIGSGLFTVLLVGSYLKSSSKKPLIMNSNNGISQNIKEVNYNLYDSIKFEETPIFPVVMIKQNGQSSPLSLNELKIDVNVVGHIATTTFEMTFYNNSNRILEGQLYFPLGENKSVSNFAMDVNGELREGVIVEKEKGRVAFESTTRRRIDPGLIEWTKGNNFKARVYPIPSKGTKKIIFAYEQELISDTNGLTYILPLGIKQMVKKFDLNVKVFQQTSKPKTANSKFQNIEFKQWEENFIAKKSFVNYTPDKQLGFSVPQTNLEPSICEEIDGINYFSTAINPKRFELEKKTPNSISIVWDVSNSGANRNHKIEIALLEQYFKNQNIQIELITFSNTTNSREKLIGFASLKKKLLTLEYDGGTQLNSVDFSQLKSDEIFLFSDGVSNFGRTNPKFGSQPIHTISSNNQSDYSNLKFLSLSTGGSFVNLNTISINNALNLLSKSPYRLIECKVIEGNATEIYPKSAVIQNKNLVITGQLYSSFAKIKLNFGFGGKIHHSETITVQTLNQPLNGSIRRLWAQNKLAHIDLRPEQNSELITEHGKKFGLVTRNTSLIVLDRIQDYVHHEIVPPESLKKQYFEIINRQRKDYTDKNTAHIKNVKSNWTEHLNWLAKEFNIPKNKKEEISNLNILEDSTAVIIGSQNQRSTSFSSEISDIEIIEEEYMSLDANESIINRESLAEVGVDDFKKDLINNKVKSNSIKIKEWSPNEPYLGAFRNDNSKLWWSVYNQQKAQYDASPSYFVDISTIFYKQGKQKEALRILSNLAELELENHQILRILGYRLIDFKEYALALDVFNKVEQIRGEEPQTYRDLGLAYEQNGNYQKAIEMLYKVITKTWDNRFPNIEQIALIEMNNIISKHEKHVDVSFIDQEFIHAFSIDIRVVLNWDSDNCDMDLWITDPKGEKCFYSHNRTVIGGRISNDFTRGYGPEQFMLKNAINGKYKIEANYYGTGSQKILTPVTLKMQFFTDYGGNNQKIKEVILRLKQQKEVVNIAEIEF